MTDDADHKPDQPTVYRAADVRAGSLTPEREARESSSHEIIKRIRETEQLAIELGTWVEDSELGRACVREAKRNPINEPTDDLLPSAIIGLKKTNKGFLWPQNNSDGRRTLGWILRGVIKSGEDGGGGPEYSYNVMARDMMAHGLRPWPTAKFFHIYNDARDRLTELDEFESKARNSAAGRKPTDKTGRIALIMETLGVGRRNAYYIEQDGTGSFHDRKALAAAFRDDPKRCFPGAWELALGGRHGRPRGRPTLANYVLSGDADFESYPSFDALRTACKLGALPDSFKNLDAFLAAMEPCGIPAEHALRIWRIGGPWRDPN